MSRGTVWCLFLYYNFVIKQKLYCLKYAVCYNLNIDARGEAMNKKSVLIAVVMIVMILFGYTVSHPVYATYDERHKAGFVNWQKENYQLAEWSFIKAAEMEPEELDSYVSLYWFYSENGETAKKNEIKNMAEEKADDFSMFEQVLSEYEKIKGSDSRYIKNSDNTVFEFYDAEDRLVKKDELYNDNKFKFCRYTYNEDSLLKSEVCYSKYPVYYYSYNNETGKYDETVKYNVSKEEKEYVYDEDNKLIKLISDSDSDQYLYYDEEQNIEKIERKNSGGRAETVEYYIDNRLQQIDYLDYDEDLKKQEFYNSDRQVIKTVNYHIFNDVKNYQIYTYENIGGTNKTVCESYTYNDVLYEHVTTVADGDNERIITQKLNPAGDVVKTTVTTESGTTIERASDNIINGRPFTKGEIDFINANHNDLAVFLGNYEIPQDFSLSNLMKYLPADEFLDFYDIEEIDNLRKEGVHTNIWGVDKDYYKCKKFYFDTIENTIKKYMNISSLDMAGLCVTGYSQEYNSFYGETLVMNLAIPDFYCAGGVVGDNYRKLYTSDYTMVFQRTDNNYYLTACYAEDHSELTDTKEEQQPASQPEQDKEYCLQLRKHIIPAGTPRADVYNRFINEYIAQRDDEFPIYEENGKSMCWLNYALYDITQDGLPELFLREGIAIPVQVYTYKNGQVIQLDSSFSNGHNGESYVIEGGMVGYRHSTTSVTYYFTKYYPDSTTESFSFGYGWVDDFYINHQAVTREEYLAFARPYITAYASDGVSLFFEPVVDKIYV